MQLKMGITNTTAFHCTHRCMYGERDNMQNKRRTNKSADVLHTSSHKAWNIAQTNLFCYLDTRLIFNHLASRYFIAVSNFFSFFFKEWWNLALTFWWEHLFYHVVEWITLDVSCTIWPMNFKDFTLADNASICLYIFLFFNIIYF